MKTIATIGFRKVKITKDIVLLRRYPSNSPFAAVIRRVLQMPASVETNTPSSTRNRKVFFILLIIGLLFFLCDGANTWHKVNWLKSQGNFVGIESEWRQFAFRNIGGLVGVALALLLRSLVLKLAKQFKRQ